MSTTFPNSNLIPGYWESRLKEALYPNLYFPNFARTAPSLESQAHQNWNLYSPEFQEIVKSILGPVDVPVSVTSNTIKIPCWRP